MEEGEGKITVYSFECFPKMDNSIAKYMTTFSVYAEDMICLLLYFLVNLYLHVADTAYKLLNVQFLLHYSQVST